MKPVLYGEKHDLAAKTRLRRAVSAIQGAAENALNDARLDQSRVPDLAGLENLLAGQAEIS